MKEEEEEEERKIRRFSGLRESVIGNCLQVLRMHSRPVFGALQISEVRFCIRACLKVVLELSKPPKTQKTRLIPTMTVANALSDEQNCCLYTCMESNQL